VKNYYTDLFREDHLNRPLLESMEFDRISDMEKTWVERKFSKEEVFNTIKARMVSLLLSIKGVGTSLKKILYR